MIAQLLLSAGLIVLLVTIYLQSLSSRLLKVALVVCILFGLYLVWLPDQANVIAQIFGVGRGADLMMYIWILMSFAGLLLLYLQSKRTDRLLTSLAREIAIQNAMHASEVRDNNPATGT